MSLFLFGWVLQNTLLASGIALLALVAARCLPRRPGVAHTLWILVLLKLVTPPFWTVALWPPAPVEAICPARILEGEVPPPARPGPTPADSSDPQPEVHMPERWSWTDGLALIALLGTLTYFGLAVSRLLRLRRLLRCLPEGEPLPELAALADSLGIAPPRVRWSRESLPPLLLAMGIRPTLVLPVALWQSLGGAERRALLLHELAHLARGDHHVRRLELIVLALFWWHPLGWFAASQLRRAEELCCDALVIATCPEIAPAYANALIETLAYLAGHPTTLPMEASGAGPVVDIRRRLGMILQNKSPYVGRGGLLMALLAIALLCPLVPTRAELRVPDTVEGLIATQKSCQQCHTPQSRASPPCPTCTTTSSNG